MSSRESRGKMLFLLGLLLIAAPVVTGLAWFDATSWHYVFLPPGLLVAELEEITVRPENIQRLKQSILHVRTARCGSEGWSSGTAFVIARGYVATAAHVIKDNQACGSEIVLVDHRGLTHRAELSGYSDETQLDLAILTFSENSLEPLRIADSKQLEAASSTVQVVTIGYPPGASTEDEAAVSGSGLISSFRDDRFFTSGMDLNPGNSGGPVFIMSDWSVLGMAIQKGDAETGSEGLGVVVPSATLAAFFRDRTGQSL